MRRNKEKEISGNFTVELRKDETFDSMLKRFLRKQKLSGLMEEIHDRKRFTKPSVKERQRKLKSIRESKRRLVEEKLTNKD
ncbi:MAG: 30S ribosomal protein S21 [Anaerolineales bacterium]|nr:30S ribosomal protein S21 [Anaerolineales bacterium]